MKRTAIWQVWYLCWFSKPVHERSLYRQIVRRKVSRIVEIGIGDGVRARRMIAAMRRNFEPRHARYTGVDLFEARPHDEPGLTLKRAHRHLGETGVQLRLVPGDPYSALARTANALTGNDLIVISSDQLGESLNRAWFYLPRMLHDQSLVLCEGGFNTTFETISVEELQQRAKAA